MMEGGGFYFDKDGNTQVNSEASIQAMETCKNMYDADITFNNSSWDDMVAGMGADKFACIADAVWMVGSIKDAVPDQDGKWAVMPFRNSRQTRRPRAHPTAVLSWQFPQPARARRLPRHL